MSDVKDRLANLSQAQRRLLEMRLRERGWADRDSRAAGLVGEVDASAATSTSDSAEHPDAWRARPAARPMEFSLYFFSDDGSRANDAKYRLALEAARFADVRGFSAVWTPERHFQPFGGLYPNPSVLGAALAAITTRVGIRAGSVALPLHSPVRVAEEWAVVDNLSNGRVGVSFASGWHPDDFVLFPSSYDDRKEVMFSGIELIRRLWAGESVTLPGPGGEPVVVRTLPRPLQATLPIWITTAGNTATWERAGAVGANVLAAMVGYTPQELTEQVRRYRQARAAAGHAPDAGRVTLVAHAYVGQDDAEVKAQVREPMTSYLQSYLAQFQKLGLAASDASERDARDVAALAFEHYFATSTLLGTQAKCARVVDSVAACGVDEIACLIDFGLEADTVLEALDRLDGLRAHFAAPLPAAHAAQA